MVDDDENVRRLVAAYLERESYEVSTAADTLERPAFDGGSVSGILLDPGGRSQWPMSSSKYSPEFRGRAVRVARESERRAIRTLWCLRICVGTRGAGGVSRARAFLPVFYSISHPRRVRGATLFPVGTDIPPCSTPPGRGDPFLLFDGLLPLNPRPACTFREHRARNHPQRPLRESPQTRKNPSRSRGSCMVSRVGLEPTTIGLKVRCSTN